MNWESINFDWNQVRAFLVTAEEGSLTAAARALKLTQPTVGRQVFALEHSLGLVLFERVGRSLKLTQSGFELLEHVRAMGEAASRVSLTASGQAEAVAGPVCVSATHIVAAYVLPEVIEHLRASAPGLVVEVVASNAVHDLRRREADIAVRHVEPTEPDLIASLVVESSAHLYASPHYLEKRGRPQAPRDLCDHDFIGFETSERLVGGLNALGLNLTAENFRTFSDNGIVAWELVRRGVGIGVMMKEIAAMTPDVEQVLPALEPIRVPVWLTTHRELHTSQRIRTVFDALRVALTRPR